MKMGQKGFYRQSKRPKAQKLGFFGLKTLGRWGPFWFLYGFLTSP